MRKQKGLSLIELMIAITLGLILMTGVLQVFMSSKGVYVTQQALSRVQETGRLGIEFLARDIRMAGYMGCASRSAQMTVTNTLNNSATYPFDFLTHVRGYTAAALPANHGLSPLPRAGTDFFVLRGAYGTGVEVVENNSAGQVFVSNTGTVVGGCGANPSFSGLCDGDILIVTDCTKARVFQATNVQEASGAKVNLVHSAAGNPGNAISSWGGAGAPDDEVFKPGAEVMAASTITYFIATGASGRPSLWQNVNGTNLELLEGVDDMSVRYGVDSNEDYVPDNYLAAGAVAAGDWEKVVALRIELLVSSIEDGVLAEAQSYSFEGVDNIMPDPVDRRLRQVFTTTVGIRSRSF